MTGTELEIELDVFLLFSVTVQSGAIVAVELLLILLASHVTCDGVGGCRARGGTG